MSQPNCTDSAPEAPLTWVRGSYIAAYRSFWLPWSERSGPVLGHLLLALSLNALIAAAIAFAIATFDKIPVWAIFTRLLLYTESIGISIMTFQGVSQALLGMRGIRNLPPLLHTAYWAAVAFTGGYLGFLLADYIRLGDIGSDWNPAKSLALSTTLGLVFIITFVLHSLASSSWRASEARAVAERERLRSLAAEAAASQAHLKLLQAQIEPHFLFNVLANVVSLIDSRPADARGMLDDLIRYLRANLVQTRQETTTLGAEADALEAYLSVFRYRMGARLSFTIDIEEALRRAAIVPMLLQPIVENALKHGLEPKIDGGFVAIRALLEAGSVVVEIADSGLGFGELGAGGFGLSNVRDRLALIYGTAGRLAVSERSGGGTVVTVTVPFRTGP